ncbi:uncharacterized protein [Amphiura filiformis]|uniref:uncharacterized protein n=1 Tax=Amphiura filiformis TaxID=82378 RepID=UPI003B214783
MLASNDSEKNTAETVLSPKETAELQRAFDVFVIKGRENVILAKDLGNVLRSVGQNMSNLEILDMINELDEDGDGRITFDKFIKAIAPKVRENSIGEEIQEAFRVFDKDGNGVISLDEFRTVLRVAIPEISQSELNGMLHDMDVNHDGTIDYQEFVKTMGPVLDQS